MSVRSWVIATVAVLITLTTAGCGGSGVTPGHSSPAAAVAGFVDGLTANDGQAACSYVTPSEQGECRTDLNVVRVTGSITVGHTVERGSRAITSTTGHACLVVSGQKACGSNHQPDAGMPGAARTFAAAYQASQNSNGGPNSPEFWVQTTIEQNGKWYLGGAG